MRGTPPVPWLAPALLFALCAAALAGDRRPNLVLIVADDLGYGHLGCYGQRRIETPRLDRLADEGLRFTRFYAGSSVCAPSRSVLMTGLHGGHTPVRRNTGGVPLADADVTLAEVLKAAGYATGCFGKWGLGDAGTPGVPWKQGFDEFFGYLDQVHAHSHYPGYLWDNDRRFPLPGNGARASDGMTGSKRGQYSHDVIFARALEFIRRHRAGPFFCYLPVTLPHTELLVPEDSLKRYAGRWPEPHPYVSRIRHYADQLQPRAAFAAMVSRLDRDVGRLVDLLAELGIEERTLVLFTSDNGGQDGAGVDAAFFRANGPLRGHKATLFEGGIRVPMIARWPGHVSAGRTSDHAWDFTDLLPTLAELGCAEPPRGIDGISMTAVLLGRKNPPRHEFQYWERSRFDPVHGWLRPGTLEQAVRAGRYKAIRLRPGAPVMLFDLESDAAESNDLAARLPGVVARLTARMERAHRHPRIQVEPTTLDGRAFR